MRRSIVALFVALLAFIPNVAAQTSGLSRATSQLQKGDQALAKGDVRRARSSFEKALEILPDFPEAHLGLGHVCMQEQRFEDALGHYLAALEGFEQAGGIMRQFEAQEYTRAQERIRQLEDYRREINNPNTKMTEALRSRKNVEIDNQITQLRALSPPDSGDEVGPPPRFYFHLGNAYYRLQRVGEAIEQWEHCISEAPEFPLVYNNLAVAYLVTDRLEDARRTLDRAEDAGVEVNPALESDIDARLAAR
jgi:tetratricopeptide (TPR) repeat protein